MNERRWIWFSAMCLLVLAAGSATAQSASGGGSPDGALPAPEAAAPAAPDNPFVPPPCTGTVFTDVTCSTLFDAWIEQYAADQITGGCGGGNYCPGSPVTRAQMAVFVEKAMRGTATWSPGNLGGNNTGLGDLALLHNTQATDNTAIGYAALWTQSFDNGGSPWNSNNTAVGTAALYSNQPTSIGNGNFNTAIGAFTLQNNVTGSANTAVGDEALHFTSTASENTAVGAASLGTNVASDNTAVGSASLTSNLTGFDNTAIGWKAGARAGDSITGYTGSTVMFVSNQTGSYNTFIGISGALAEVDNCTAVGMDAYCDATNQVRLGNFFVNSIGGKVAWSALSDARAKSDVRDLDLGLDLVLALRPVSYRYKSGDGRTGMGFVAQDVEAVLGDGYSVLDIGGGAERTLSLRYTDLLAPLVKAVQEQEARIQARDERIAKLEGQTRTQQARLDALERQLEALLGRARLAADAVR